MSPWHVMPTPGKNLLIQPLYFLAVASLNQQITYIRRNFKYSGTCGMIIYAITIFTTCTRCIICINVHKLWHVVKQLTCIYMWLHLKNVFTISIMPAMHLQDNSSTQMPLDLLLNWIQVFTWENMSFFSFCQRFTHLAHRPSQKEWLSLYHLIVRPYSWCSGLEWETS